LVGLWKDEEGQGLGEHGLLLAVLALTAVDTMGQLGNTIKDIFSNGTGNLSGSKAFAERRACAVKLKLRRRDVMQNLLLRLWKDEEGQDLVEYALILVLLALAAVGSMSNVASAINTAFGNAAANLSPS
jgi:pilus assembly protein Flp/PilA